MGESHIYDIQFTNTNAFKLTCLLVSLYSATSRLGETRVSETEVLEPTKKFSPL